MKQGDFRLFGGANELCCPQRSAGILPAGAGTAPPPYPLETPTSSSARMTESFVCPPFAQQSSPSICEILSTATRWSPKKVLRKVSGIGRHACALAARSAASNGFDLKFTGGGAYTNLLRPLFRLCPFLCNGNISKSKLNERDIRDRTLKRISPIQTVCRLRPPLN